jgi:pimeloyl-ACP methyl ester carboxylesterase
VNPLYLGTAERRIFGIHEPAASNGGRPRAAVLCNPWGNEYIYAHRSMRQLAIKLSICGYHTLRFDYFGTGDSAGDEFQTDLAGLQADVEVAMEALKDITEAPKVALIGLRVGANIAAHVASRSPAEVEALVLWDPILSGDQYVQSLSASSPQILRDLRALDLRPTLDQLPGRSLILVTEEQRSYEEVSRARVESGANPAPLEFVTAPCPWVEAVTTTGALPVRIIQRIQEWLQ